jgi:chromosomal replication initiator protein
VTDSLDIVSTRRRKGTTRGSAFARGEIAMLPCGRCKQPEVPWEMRSFGGKPVCRNCYAATIELAHGAIRAMPAGEKDRRCSNCRAMQDPTLGSAWCPLIELGDERARICENFSSVHQPTESNGHIDVVPVPQVLTFSTAPTEQTPAPRNERKAGFNPHYTFAEFIVGAGNRLAHASALACVDKPGEAYNPLVLYGGVGVGKTHLLQAIGQAATDRGHDALYVTSETFTNELIASIRQGSTVAFRERYRCVDYLLLDDVQFIAGKEATQEEFFHTFNALHQVNKQIVLSSDRPPAELRVLEARLRSRFEWGLTADLQPPDLETRIAIARQKAALRGRKLPETALMTLATRAGKNVRELEGALNRVLALSDLLEVEPSMEIVRQVLGDPEDRNCCQPTAVLEAVSAYYRVKSSELSGPQRERRISYARQIAMYLLREEAKLSLIEIGNQLGGRNHSTVIYSCDKIAESKTRGQVKNDLQAVKHLIYGVW